MFQLAHEKEPARTRPAALKPKADKAWGENQFQPSRPEDCEPSVEPEDFGKGGVGVEVQSEYGLDLTSAAMSVGKWMGAFKFDGPNSALVRWSKEKTSLKGCNNHELGCHGLGRELLVRKSF